MAHASAFAIDEKAGLPPARTHGSGIAAFFFIGIPVLLVALCLAAKFGYVSISAGPRAGLIFALLIALMLTGMPISIALGLTVLIFVFTLTEVPIDALALKLFTGIERFEIMAIPFFILAGSFLTHGGVARRMIDFATSVVGHWHGGLALAGIVACAMFALVCGSSVATVVAIGSIVLPEMVRHGYPMRFGAGVITVAGSLGILMLPSIPKVIYAISTNTSVGALFVAGLLPGTLLTVMLCSVTWYLARKRNYPRMQRASWTESWRAFRQSVWGLMLVVIIIGASIAGSSRPPKQPPWPPSIPSSFRSSSTRRSNSKTSRACCCKRPT
jgi:C4-dicarboxylate transporter DctM subunit